MDPDLPLLEALKAGEDEALNELMARHKVGLHGFVYRYLMNEAAAADVVQETFVRAYFKAGTFRPSASVKSWLYAIALNLCRDHARRLSRSKVVPFQAVSEEGAATEPEAVDCGCTPRESVEQEDRFEILRRAIALLPHKLRTPLVLFSLEGRPQNEVAEIMGVTPKTVELRVYHAKGRLRTIMEALLPKCET